MILQMKKNRAIYEPWILVSKSFARAIIYIVGVNLCLTPCAFSKNVTNFVEMFS